MITEPTDCTERTDLTDRAGAPALASGDAGCPSLRLGLPKGRMQDGVAGLLAEAGLDLRFGGRAYRPSLDAAGWDVKLLKPQSILEMLDAGSRDVGFAGADWAGELDVDVLELLDTGLDPVRIVAAAPPAILEQGLRPHGRPRRHGSIQNQRHGSQALLHAAHGELIGPPTAGAG